MSWNFYDVHARKSYADFLRQMEMDKAYAQSNGAYPLGSRRYSSRHWRLRPDGSIDILYINRKAEDAYESKDPQQMNYESWHTKRRLATVYPDDTFTIHRGSQGDNELLSRVFGFYMHHDVRRGGTVVEKGNNIFPLFKGNRFQMGSIEPLVPYKVFHRKVNRKTANEAMKEYAELLNIALPMLAPMDLRGLREVAHDLHEELRAMLLDFPDNVWALFQEKHAKPLFFEKVRKQHYVDATVLYGMMHFIHSSTHVLLNETNHDESWTQRFVRRTVTKMLNDIRKDVCYQHNTFKLIELEQGHLPQSRWEPIVLVNDQPAKRL